MTHYEHQQNISVVVFLVLLTMGSIHAASPQKALTFDSKIYQPNKFRISKRVYPYGDVTVRLIQVKNLGYTQEPHACRTWFELRKGNLLLKQLYFADIDPAGFSYGIFVPKVQPLPDYFIAVKEGDYDGRLLLVEKDGHFANLPGGFYFLTADKRFLVGDYATDDNVLIVVDVAQRKVVIDGRRDRKIPEDLQWYRDSVGYFFTTPDESSKGWPQREKKGHIYRLDLDQLTVKSHPITEAQFATAQKVGYDFDPRQKEDCTSKPQ